MLFIVKVSSIFFLNIEIQLVHEDKSQHSILPDEHFDGLNYVN